MVKLVSLYIALFNITEPIDDIGDLQYLVYFVSLLGNIYDFENVRY